MGADSYEGQAKETDDQASAPVTDRKLWKRVLATACGLIVVVIILATVRQVSLRRIPELTPAAFTAALEKWEANGPKSYDLDLEIGGNRPGTVHVEVRSGIVTAMTRDGRTPDQERTWYIWSVPGQFDTIEREMELAEDPAGEMHLGRDTRLWLRCEFDPQFGYPRVFHRAVSGGGPEVYWKVTKFEPR